MTTRTRTNRTSRNLDARLESLESREVLSGSYAGALQAALSQSHGPGPRAARFAMVRHALPLARPGSAFQGASATAPGGDVDPRQTPGAMPSNTRAALFARVQARRAAFASARAEAAPRAWPGRLSLRFPIAAPTTPVDAPINPATPTTPMTNDDSGSTAESLPPNVSGALNTIYQNFVKNNTLPVGDAPGSIRVDGSNVGVAVHGNGQGDFSAFVATLQNLGMEITSSSDVYWTVNGMLPINQLPTAAATPQTRSITPIFVPTTF